MTVQRFRGNDPMGTGAQDYRASPGNAAAARPATVHAAVNRPTGSPSPVKNRLSSRPAKDGWSRRSRGLDNPFRIVYTTSEIAGWSSPVARQAHNLEVAGAKPAPAIGGFPPEPAKVPACGRDVSPGRVRFRRRYGDAIAAHVAKRLLRASPARRRVLRPANPLAFLSRNDDTVMRARPGDSRRRPMC